MKPAVETHTSIFDVYHGKKDTSLRLATVAGAGLPGHLNRKHWVLMPTGASPIHSDASKDIAARGYCFFQVVNG